MLFIFQLCMPLFFFYYFIFLKHYPLQFRDSSHGTTVPTVPNVRLPSTRADALRLHRLCKVLSDGTFRPWA